MHSFGGQVQAMINSLKANKALRGKRKSGKELLEGYAGNHRDPLQFKDATEKEIENFKQALHVRRKRERIRNFVIYLVVFGGVILALYLMF